MEHQFHFDKKFYKDKKAGYWISTMSPKIRAHVWVWKCHYGEIPKGLHVHHIDGNKDNNDIDNLELITVKEHFRRHDTPQRRKANLVLIDKIRPLTKEWHASEEGREWHRKHGLRVWNERETFQIICKQCGKDTFTKTYHQEVCSNACKSALRRVNKLDNEIRVCAICSEGFSVNKYAKSRTCSRKCGGILRHKKH